MNYVIVRVISEKFENLEVDTETFRVKHVLNYLYAYVICIKHFEEDDIIRYK